MGVGNWFSCRETRNERNGKMIRINQIKLTPDKGKEELVQKAAKILRISEKEILSLKIRKQSTDARKKPNIMYVYTVDVEVSNEQKIMRRQKGNQVTLIHETPYDFPNSGTKKMERWSSEADRQDYFAHICLPSMDIVRLCMNVALL